MHRWTGIVLASVVFAAEIIDEKLFVALVLTSILTSLISGIWLLWRRDVIINNNNFIYFNVFGVNT